MLNKDEIIKDLENKLKIAENNYVNEILENCAYIKEICQLRSKIKINSEKHSVRNIYNTLKNQFKLFKFKNEVSDDEIMAISEAIHKEVKC